MIVPLVQQVRFHSARQIEKLVAAVAEGAWVVGPEDACGAVAQDIDKTNGIDIGNRRGALDDDWIASAVAVLVEPDRDLS